MKISKKLLDRIIDEEIDRYLEENLEEGWRDWLGAAALATGIAGAGVGTGVALKNADKYKSPTSQVQTIDKEKEIQQEPEPEIYKPIDVGINSLNKIGQNLKSINSTYFNDKTPQGRAAIAIATLLGGVEVFNNTFDPDKMFTMRGGYQKVPKRDSKGKIIRKKGKVVYKIIKDVMQGFAQFNTLYHADKLSTPTDYTKFLGDILYGKKRLPDTSSGKVNAVDQLLSKIDDIKTNEELQQFFKSIKFGKNNWHGIDAGFHRLPEDFTEKLKNYIQQGDNDQTQPS